MGFHPENRNGDPPNGERCADLFQMIFKAGFDSEEANTNGVVVAQRPAGTSISDFNKTYTEGDPLFAPAVAGGGLQFGSLSHSHLNQVLKNISGGVKYNAPSIVGPDGTIALNLLATRDHAFAEHVQNGLMWDVLAWEMEDEEPDACTVVQAAMNSKNNTYLVMHEMQALSHLSRLCKKNIRGCGGARLQSAQGKGALYAPRVRRAA